MYIWFTTHTIMTSSLLFCDICSECNDHIFLSFWKSFNFETDHFHSTLSTKSYLAHSFISQMTKIISEFTCLTFHGNCWEQTCLRFLWRCWSVLLGLGSSCNGIRAWNMFLIDVFFFFMLDWICAYDGNTHLIKFLKSQLWKSQSYLYKKNKCDQYSM